MAGVLVTRPQPGASRTARRLEDQGLRPIVLPLTETRALAVEAAAVRGAAAVAVTSANGVRHAPRELVAALASLPCHAVGKRTAEACRAAGFSRVSEGAGDAEAMADAIAVGLAGKDIVYLCGRVRFPAFEQRLAAAGVKVDAMETYDTAQLDYSDDDLMTRLAGERPDAVLLYSAKAAAAASALVRRPALRKLFEKATFFALSGRVAGALEGIADERIHVAQRPDEDALLRLLSPRR